MFPRLYRLSREEIGEISKKGSVKHTPFFSVKYLDLKQSHFKCAFVISKKECKLSVDRNRAKRRARTALREILPEITSIGFIVYVKKAAITVDFEDLANDFKKVFKISL
jgi:ribonuclease P protein component